MEKLVRENRWTIDETCHAFEKKAYDLGEQASLSPRQLARWMGGQVDRPRPVMQRVAEEFWGHDFAVLLGPPDTADLAAGRPSNTPGRTDAIEPLGHDAPTAAVALGQAAGSDPDRGYGTTWEAAERPGHVVGWQRTPEPIRRTVGVWGLDANALVTGRSVSASLDGLAEGDGLESSVQRRILLQQVLATLAVGPGHAVDAVREGLAASLPERPAGELDVAEWASVAQDYEHAYYNQSPRALVLDLAADLADLQRDLGAAAEPVRPELSRIAALLTTLMAMSLVNLGQFRSARRWWRTARHAADSSTDTAIRVLVRSHDATHAIYEQRPLRLALHRADEAIAISGRSVHPGTAEALGARAQMLALLGRAGEARDAIEHLNQAFNRLPTAVTSTATILSGWPQRRLWHTTSYVHTHLGDVNEAATAQEQALALIPGTAPRSRAQIQLHAARRLIQAGHITDGTRHAQAILTALPTPQRTALVTGVARQVLDAVPGKERSRPAVKELDELLRPVGQPRIHP
ncbi:hypothetical protein ACFQ1L_01360 [Phytohabitans flavus]|uniref:hypothetical protein n=1 Tax=Phytohabitans flavus TaxID=1076124 RepID=UPI00363FA3DE